MFPVHGQTLVRPRHTAKKELYSEIKLKKQEIFATRSIVGLFTCLSLLQCNP